MRQTDFTKATITEGYIKQVGNNPLVEVFAEYNKLTGFLEEDTAFINEFAKLLEDDDFDPFSHLEKADKINVRDDCVLSIGSDGNKKMTKMGTKYFSLPAGYTCPFADKCKSMASRKGTKFKDGKKIKDMGDYRCYAASTEVQYKDTRNLRWRNFDLLQKHKGDAKAMAELIDRSLKVSEQEKGSIRLLRIHDSGDFFSQAYFDAWMMVAQSRPDIHFYAYTKSLPYWKNSKDLVPKNMRLIASEGGKADDMISKEQFRKAVVVKDQGEAIEKRLNIDVDDFLAAFGEDDFALLLHGVQGKQTGLHSQSQLNSKFMKSLKNMPSGNKTEVAKLLKYYAQDL